MNGAPDTFSLQSSAQFQKNSQGRIFLVAMLLGLVLGVSVFPALPLYGAADNQVASEIAHSVLGKVVTLPDTVAEVQSPSTGRILPPRERPYTIGETVKKGDPLAIIENRYNLHDASHLSTVRWDLLWVMLDARTAAVTAKVEREKAERLQKLGSVSGQRVQELKAVEAVTQAEYQKRRALLDQGDVQIRGSELVRKGLFSPIDGTISAITFTQGQTINEGIVLFRVVNRKVVGFAARFPENEFRLWSSKSKAKVHFDALPGKVFEGTVEVISPIVDPLARTRDVVFRVANPNEYLRYGMVGWLELE
jgi:RND family efflux transporter MFP subunit